MDQQNDIQLDTDVLGKDELLTLTTQIVSSHLSGTGLPVEQSISPDYIYCLEDGKKFRMLKKHLRACYDMSPEEYRAKWGLNADYPMVAPNYAVKRQELARQSGLGKKRI